MTYGQFSIFIKLRQSFTVLLLIIITLSLQLNTTHCQVRFKDKIFSSTTVDGNIPFGRSKKVTGDTMSLIMDIYQPGGDNLLKRPVMIWVHGGSLTTGNKSEMQSFCREFALRGFVSATIEYRIGIPDPQTPKTFREALLRAVQDAKAAVRYFRMKAAELRIDTNYIFMGGASAGSFIALHCAYWDQNELSQDIDQATWGNLEGSSGNPGYSSGIQAVCSYAGAMVDTLCINAGEPPVALFQGSDDPLVPIDVGIFYQPHTEMYGSRVISRVATRMGIRNQILIENGMGHGIETPAQTADLINLCTNLLYPLAVLTDVDDANTIPDHLTLQQNFPNPFNPSTTIKYAIPSDTHVTLQVLDVLGRTVALLVDEEKPFGIHQATFSGLNLSSGVYFYRIQAGSLSEVKRMVLIK